ncbi:MFS general substrate transporter [Coniophora puteana RWD-64-598 SS2]|uniref:MFS general substrate transporter n=1 Tax=Coniophora puteana (strain RWD-64-598) TaxID=741705 RepID=A0A5M3M943_CONPW|nr:MFS general substrate transporter [Coniophora puteana RWD-64-598 SS2]EIW75310.1 MFS general substrate transporter [Coniophora puteana RWD-64-598 SS2]
MLADDKDNAPVSQSGSEQPTSKGSEGGFDDREQGTFALDHPEGGWAAWCTVLGAFLVQMCSYGYTNSFGVYQEYYTTTFMTNESASVISWIGSVNAFLFELGGVAAGRLYDRGYFYTVVYGGCFMQSFSLFMLSFAKPDKFYQVFLAQGIASGISSGVLYIPTMVIVSEYFSKRRALMMAIVASGAAVGSVIHPIILNNALNGRIGFATGVRASAGLVSGLLLLACCLMRTRVSATKRSSISFVKTIKGCVKDISYMLGMLSTMSFAIALYYPVFYLQLDAASHNLQPVFSFYSRLKLELMNVQLVVLNASSFVGQIISGFLAHIFGVPIVMLVAIFGGSVMVFAMAGITSVAGVVVFAIMYGIFFGMLAALTPNHEELGARMGISCAFMAISDLIDRELLTGTPISGALLGTQYVWWKPAVFNGVSPLQSHRPHLNSHFRHKSIGAFAFLLAIGMRFTINKYHLRKSAS